MKKLEDKIGEFVIAKSKNVRNYATIGKVVLLNDKLYINGISTVLPNGLCNRLIEKDYIIEKIDSIESVKNFEWLLKKYFKYDVVEGRKYKLKLLEKL